MNFDTLMKLTHAPREVRFRPNVPVQLIWTWEMVFDVWKRRISEFSIDPDPLFVSLPVHDPEHADDPWQVLAWWPKNESERRKRHLQLQQGLYDRRYDIMNTAVYGNVFYHRKGEQLTLDYLHEHQDDPETVAAILLAASFFSRLRSSRGYIHESHWPIEDARNIENLALQKWLGSGYHEPWPLSCTQVIPFQNQDFSAEIDDTRELIRYLGKEHATLLSQYQPVILEFGAKSDPDIEVEIRREKEERDKKERARLVQREAGRREQANRLAECRQRHPRYGELDKLSAVELKRLVWEMPATEVAREFGVSDTAVKKRCRKLGIPKPPRGYWARVYAGKQPKPSESIPL